MVAVAGVVGGGPAGLMAAEVLASAGVAVTVFERMPTVGRKFQVAGRGGLNLTHSEPRAEFVQRYGDAAPFIAPLLDGFGPGDLRAWSATLGEATFVGSSGRVFPEGFRATALLRAWMGRLKGLGVEVRTGHTWCGWTDAGQLALRDGNGTAVAFTCDLAVLAPGGASWPRTGSDGSWTSVVEADGIDVVPLRATNCGFVSRWSGVFGERFAGTPVKDVALRHGGAHARGDLMITTDGIEGGPVYALSAHLRATLDSSPTATVEVDLFPDAGAALETRFARRRPKDSVTTRLRRAGLTAATVGLLREVTGNRVPDDPAGLVALLHALPLVVTSPQPIERAISTAGGIALPGLDDHLMLRGRPGTFVAGEALDWEAPTGGYLLQGAFSTGVAAARGGLAWLATVQP